MDLVYLKIEIMKVKGKIINILPTKVVSDKFKTREFWVKTNEQYPQTLCLQLSQEKCDTFNAQIGSDVTCDINLRGREWTSPQGETKVFNTIECWRWTIESGQAQQAPAPQQQGEPVDDLPF